MGIGNAFRNMVSGAAAGASAAKEKLADSASVMRLESEIRQAEADIEHCTGEIGKQYAARYADDINGEFGSYLRQIRKSRSVIAGLRSRINSIKGIRHCQACGNEIDIHAAFCPKCGATQ